MRLAILSILILPACSPAASPDPTAEIRDLPATVTLAVGESRVVNGVAVKLAAVKSDSRCPSDVQCAWAGNAELTIEIGTAPVSINSHLDPKSATAGGLTVGFVSLEPYPVSTRTTTGYRAELRIETAIR
jgi:hypothetical protein